MGILGLSARHSVALNARLHRALMFEAQVRRTAVLGRPVFSALLVIAGLALASCSSVSNFTSDHWPTWAGGMPKDVPPRPGSPGYDEFLVHQQGKDVAPQVEQKDNASAAPAARPLPGQGSAQGALY